MKRALADTCARLLDDPGLRPYSAVMERRAAAAAAKAAALAAGPGSLVEFASAHEYFGLHFRDGVAERHGTSVRPLRTRH